MEGDEWLLPPAVPLPAGVEARAVVEDETITVTTSRIGHPLLVKVSYHPRWRAEGAHGPYLVSPALMLIVPRQPTVRLAYARTASDLAGMALTLGATLAGLALAVRRWARRGQPRPAPSQPPIPLDACAAPPPTRRWGAAVPALLLGACVAARLWSERPVKSDTMEHYERASRAYAEGRYGDAAEYARHAVGPATAAALRAELLCLRGESLLRAGQPRQATAAFQGVLAVPDPNPYVAQALFGLVRSRSLSFDDEGARAARDRLRREFQDSPWARRAEKEALAAAPPG